MVTLKTNNGGHVYTFEGRDYPSVTTILSRTAAPEDKAYLDNWRRNYTSRDFATADEYVKYTSIRGTLVHYNILNSVACTILDPSHLPPISEWWARRDMLINDIEKSKVLWDKLNLQPKTPIIIETPGYHPVLKYAGTPDMVARIDGVMTVIDLKTSSGIRSKHKTQIGAYAKMINHGMPGFVKEGLLIYVHPRFDRALICEIHEKELKEEMDVFEDFCNDFWKIPGIKKEYGLS